MFSTQPASAENSYRFGVEGYQDNYLEDSVKLSEHARFAGITADYIHSANGYFTSVQLRTAYGKDNYKSISGVIRNIPQYEGELRVISGVNLPIPEVGGVKEVSPYVGLGVRYFYDNSKGFRTNTGALAYDRRITQFYIPIGANWQFTHGDFVFSPNLEMDVLFYGHVNSRFRNFDPTAKNLENIQKRGLGARGELMIGQKYEDFSWQIGPYFRYWKVADSDTDTIPTGASAGTYLEPENKRLQTGAKLQVQF